MYRVLLVEDEEIIRKGIRYSVPWEECGCSVVGEAENGAVGEEKIAELQPDIVITDITMPVKNGLEMIADTREKFNYIAIILTGYSEFEYAQQAIRNGVSDYLLKPLDMDEMRTALEKAVRLAGDNQYLQQREDEAEAVRSRTALPPLSEDKVTDPLVLRIVAYLKENYRSKITLAAFRNSSTTRNDTSTRSFRKSLAQRSLTTSTAAVFRTLWNLSGKENCPSPKSAGSAALVSTNILTTFSKNTWAARCGSTRAP